MESCRKFCIRTSVPQRCAFAQHPCATIGAMGTRVIIAANVRARMAWAGISVNQIGDLMGWSRRTASYKLHGKTPITTDEVDTLAGLLSCSPGDLMSVPECFSSLSASSNSAIAA